jgi:hypothetical protein
LICSSSMLTSHAAPGDARCPAGVWRWGRVTRGSRRRRVMNLQVPSHGRRRGDAPEATPSRKRWSDSGGVGMRQNRGLAEHVARLCCREQKDCYPC